MNGNEVSCISDFYDIENLAAIEDTRFYNEPTFYKVEVGGNQSVYVSTGNIRQSQFAEIVNQSSGDISIVSGMHGGPDGSLLSEYNGVSGKQLGRLCPVGRAGGPVRRLGIFLYQTGI